MGKPRYKIKKGEQVSRKFKTIVEQFICGYKDLTHSYTPFPVEIEYLAEYVIRKTEVKSLNLKKITLTEETGSNLGKLLNGSQINEIHIQIRGDGDLALIREMKQIERYYFCNSKIRLDKIESLANSLNKSLTDIDIRNSNITDDGFRIILSVLKANLKEAKTFNYTIEWNHLSDFNALGLDELFDYVECHELKVHNNVYGFNSIEINNIYNINSCLYIYVDYYKIKTDIKLFLNRHKRKDFLVEVHENNRDCLLLLSMIDVMKDLPMKFNIYCNPNDYVGQEKVNEIMERLIKTDLTDLEIYISDLNSNSFEIIIDKLKNMKLERLSLHRMEMINFNSQTVIEPLELPGLHCLSLDYCQLNCKLTKKLFYKLEHSKLEKFSIARSNLSNKSVHSISKSLIRSNLTSLELSECGLYCKQAKIIAESLKNTNISYLNLRLNRIKNAGVKAIANVVGQTKLNTLILDLNDFRANGAIELLKSVVKTKITICHIDDSYDIDGTYEAIANILKDNKLLLKCIGKGKNEKIDEYLERNTNSLAKAKLIIDKYQKGSISHKHKYKEYFEAYELFVDTDILWNSINNKETIKLNLGNKIKDNYMIICGVISDKLEVINENSGKQTNFSDFSPEIVNKICSYLSLSDVIS